MSPKQESVTCPDYKDAKAPWYRALQQNELYNTKEGKVKDNWQIYWCFFSWIKDKGVDPSSDHKTYVQMRNVFQAKHKIDLNQKVVMGQVKGELGFIKSKNRKVKKTVTSDDPDAMLSTMIAGFRKKLTYLDKQIDEAEEKIAQIKNEKASIENKLKALKDL